MPKLKEDVGRSLKKRIRGLSREAAIEVLLGVVSLMERSVSLKSIDFPEYIEDAEKLMEGKRGEGVVS